MKQKKDLTFVVGGLVVTAKKLAEIESNSKHLQVLNNSGIQYCLICIRPYILTIMHRAVEKEQFEEADKCKNVLKGLDSWLQYCHDMNSNSAEEGKEESK